MLVIGIITLVGLFLLPGYRNMTKFVNKPTCFVLLAATLGQLVVTFEVFRNFTARIFLDKKVWERAEARFGS